MSDNQVQQNAKAPRLACYLLSCFSYGYGGDEQIGDLLEEFQYRARQDSYQAKLWFWKQTLLTIVYSVSAILASERLLKAIVVTLPLLLLPALIGFVTWLSAFDSFPLGVEDGWQRLIRGEVHSLMVEPVIWGQMLASIPALEWDMLVDTPSILWALFSVACFGYFYSRGHWSAHKLAALGYSLCLLPYLAGFFYINQYQLLPKQVGPVLAFMLLNILYILPVISVLLYRKLKLDE